MLKKILLSLFTLFLPILFFLMTGCGLFETRTPTDPDTDNGTFIPPTSADIVIDNLLTAFNTKNIDNYCNCLLDSLYQFVPSAEANSNYPSLFAAWKIADERRYFLGLKNALGQANTMQLNLTDIKYDSQSADSVVLIADYNINLELLEHPQYKGRLLLTIIPTKNGTWGISRWLDFQKEDEINNKTFSELKARFHN